MARPRSFDTQKVLRATERQFALTGYAGTSFDDISAATGLGRGSLYAAFGDKHGLFVHGLADYCDRREDELRAMLAGDDEGAIDRLRAFVKDAAWSVQRDQDHVGCMAARFAVELAGRDAEVAQRIRLDFAAIQAALIACLETAQRHGDLEADTDLPVIARHLFAVVRGLEVLASAGERPEDLQAAAEQALLCLPLTAGAADRREVIR
jgi:TetR/AcrR family transcriptional repressor of nem operon